MQLIVITTLLSAACASSALAQADYEPYAITTFAGIPNTSGFANGTGTGLPPAIHLPTAVAIDATGNRYLTSWYGTVRKISPNGVISTLAGTENSYGSADGMGSAARFGYSPEGIAVDSGGNVYVADTYSHTIRKITPSGLVTTWAGYPHSNGFADGTGTDAQFNYPRGLAVDSAGNVYVADSRNNTIRKITPQRVVTTLAGNPFFPGSGDGTGSSASFFAPYGLAVDNSGNIFVADSGNGTIRKVTPGGVVTTFAGTAGQTGHVDGVGSAAKFSGPSGVAVDSGGNVYVADKRTIRKITPGRAVSTLAGSPTTPGFVNGTGSAARFNYPADVAVDNLGNVYVADFDNHALRKVTAGGVVSTIVGYPGFFDYPEGLALDSGGTVYVADSQNHAIRKITPGGVVSTFAGLGDVSGAADGTGTAARFYSPSGVALDSAGNVYVVDSRNFAIRKITPAGVVTTLAGDPNHYGSADGTGSAARFYYPACVAVDSMGIVYVTDAANHTIRKITPGGVVTTLAGLAETPGSADGTGSAARFNVPGGIVVDSARNLYVADGSNHTIRKITPAGVVTTFAGSPSISGSADGTRNAARFNQPKGLALDGEGNIFVADYGNYTIRKITAGGLVKTVAGLAGAWGSVDDIGGEARFSNPIGLAVSGSGALYIADQTNYTIRQATPGLATTGRGDFNGDGSLDYVLFDFKTRKTVIWYLHNNSFVSSVFGPTLPLGWRLASVADINRDGKPDFIMVNASTRQTSVWFLNNIALVGSSYGPTLPVGWSLTATADFNSDGRLDYALYNPTSRTTAVWYLNGTTKTGSAVGPAVPVGWSLRDALDFNADAKADYLLINSSTRQTAIWHLNGVSRTSAVAGPTLASGWTLAGAGDFNANGKPDYVLFDRSTRRTALWYLNGAALAGTAFGPTIANGYVLASP